MNRLLYLIAIIFAIASTTVAVSSRSRRSPAGDDERKADYIYLEALREKALGHEDAAFELLSRARSLNPSDKEIGSELAMYLLRLSGGDSVKVDEAYRMIRDYYYAHPEDYYEALRYGLLNENLGDRPEALKVWSNLHSRFPDRIELAYKYADYLAAGGDSLERDKAIAIYDSLEVIEGKSIPVTTKKIQIFYQLDDTAAVLGEAGKLLRSAPQSVDFNIFAGQIYSLMNRNDSAIIFLNRACEIDPSNGMANYSRAQFYNSIGDTVAYDREVFQALTHDNLEVETKLAILRSYIEKMYTDSAAQPRIDNLFDVLIDLHPHERDIHDMFARYLIVKQNYAQAAEQEELSLDLDPSDEEGWTLLSSLYFQTDDYDKAEESMRRALKYFPENSEFYQRIAAARQIKEDYDGAIEYLNKSLEFVDSTDLKTMGQIYASMADALHSQGKTDEALDLYSTAIVYDPDNSGALNNYAYYLALEGRDLDKALTMIQRSLEEDPESVNSLDTYAWVLFKMKDYAKAKEVIDSTMEKSEEPSAEVLEHAGDIYFMNGEPDQAVEFWKQSLELNPDSELLRRKVKNKTYFYK